MTQRWIQVVHSQTCIEEMWGSTKLTSSNKRSQITKGIEEQPKNNWATHMGARSKRYLNLEAQNNNNKSWTTTKE
jgi:hypothetical protein